MICPPCCKNTSQQALTVQSKLFAIHQKIPFRKFIHCMGSTKLPLTKLKIPSRLPCQQLFLFSALQRNTYIQSVILESFYLCYYRYSYVTMSLFICYPRKTPNLHVMMVIGGWCIHGLQLACSSISACIVCNV